MRTVSAHNVAVPCTRTAHSGARPAAAGPDTEVVRVVLTQKRRHVRRGLLVRNDRPVSSGSARFLRTAWARTLSGPLHTALRRHARARRAVWRHHVCRVEAPASAQAPPRALFQLGGASFFARRPYTSECTRMTMLNAIITFSKLCICESIELSGPSTMFTTTSADS